MPFAAWILFMYFVADLLAVFYKTVNKSDPLEFTTGLLCVTIATHSIAFWCVVSLATAAR